VEWDAVAAENARRQSGRPVSVGDFRSLDLPTGAYRLIVLSHVFEHLDLPVPALRRLTALLAPGGRVVLFYPNPESLGAWLFGRDWFPWDAPRHLSLPTIRALTTAAKSVGFDLVRARSEAQNAVDLFSLSRSYRAGRRVDAAAPAVAAVDRALAWLERLALRLHLNLGEEVVVVLARR
jgi:SAM-dependent methyltransferase